MWPCPWFVYQLAVLGDFVCEMADISERGITRARSGRRARPPCLVPASVSTLLRPCALLPFAAEAPVVMPLGHRLVGAFELGLLGESTVPIF